MDSKILIILAIVLFILIILNHVSIVVTPPSPTTNTNDSTNSQSFGYIQTQSNCSNLAGCCSLTRFGCCPDGVNSRVDSLGSNCPKTYDLGISNTNIVQPTVTPQNVYIPPQNIIKPLA